MARTPPGCSCHTNHVGYPPYLWQEPRAAGGPKVSNTAGSHHLKQVACMTQAACMVPSCCTPLKTSSQGTPVMPGLRQHGAGPCPAPCSDHAHRVAPAASDGTAHGGSNSKDLHSRGGSALALPAPRGSPAPVDARLSRTAAPVQPRGDPVRAASDLGLAHDTASPVVSSVQPHNMTPSHSWLQNRAVQRFTFSVHPLLPVTRALSSMLPCCLLYPPPFAPCALFSPGTLPCICEAPTASVSCHSSASAQA